MMILLTVSFLFFITILMSSNFPMNMIISIILTALSGSMFMIKTLKMTWMSMIVMMVFVGGLMVVYIFILTLNSNNLLKEITFSSLFIPLLFCTLFSFVNSKVNLSKSGSTLFSLNWWSIMWMMLVILIPMIFMSSMVFLPMKPSKKMK